MSATLFDTTSRKKCDGLVQISNETYTLAVPFRPQAPYYQAKIIQNRVSLVMYREQRSHTTVLYFQQILAFRRCETLLI